MIDSLIPIIKLSHQFNAVERDPKSYDLKRHENDSEHSYQLAIVAWYMAEQLDETLNKEKLLKYALIHDLVEVYAGDTAPFTSDAQKNNAMRATKDQREEAALQRLSKEFPDFKDMTAAMETYEEKCDPESRFVYILDKVITDLNCYLSGELYYHDRGFSYDQWVEWFAFKGKKLVNPSNLEQQLWNDYFRFMTEHKEHFFPR